MHFHHKHDIAGCTDDHHDWPDHVTALFATLDRMEIRLMSALQDQIDALAQQLAAAAGDLSAEVDNLQTQLAAATVEPQVDLSALQAAVAQVAALVPAPAPEPVVDAAPADSSSDVPVDPQPSVDGAVPAAGIPSVPLA